MPTITHNLPGLNSMLAKLATKHCRTLDQEATVALRRYIEDGADAGKLPDDLLVKAREGDGREPAQFGIPQDVALPLWKLAEKHVRSPEMEAAWGVLWYINEDGGSQNPAPP